MIIGQKADLDLLPPLTEEEYAATIAQSSSILSQGIPPEIPVTAPAGFLVKVTATLKKYHDELAKIQESLPQEDAQKKVLWDLLHPVPPVAPKVIAPVLHPLR